MAENEKNLDSRFRGNDIIRNQIHRLRFERGEMTQQHLADKVKATRQTINAIEAGKYSPSLTLAFRIAKALGSRIEEVFQFEGTTCE